MHSLIMSSFIFRSLGALLECTHKQYHVPHAAHVRESRTHLSAPHRSEWRENRTARMYTYTLLHATTWPNQHYWYANRAHAHTAIDAHVLIVPSRVRRDVAQLGSAAAAAAAAIGSRASQTSTSEFRDQSSTVSYSVSAISCAIYIARRVLK